MRKNKSNKRIRNIQGWMNRVRFECIKKKAKKKGKNTRTVMIKRGDIGKNLR